MIPYIVTLFKGKIIVKHKKQANIIDLYDTESKPTCIEILKTSNQFHELLKVCKDVSGVIFMSDRVIKLEMEFFFNEYFKDNFE